MFGAYTMLTRPGTAEGLQPKNGDLIIKAKPGVMSWAEQCEEHDKKSKVEGLSTMETTVRPVATFIESNNDGALNGVQHQRIVLRKAPSKLQFMTDDQKVEIAKLPYALPFMAVKASQQLQTAPKTFNKSLKVGKKQVKGVGKNNSWPKALHKLRFPSPQTILNTHLVYKMVKSLDSVWSVITGSAVSPVYATHNTTFNLIGDYTTLGGVFDQYRIAMVEMEYVAEQTVNTGSTDPGMFHTVVDFDDSTPLTSVAQALDYDNCITTLGLKNHKHVFVPHVAVASYSGAFTSFNNVTSPWIDIASPSVEHYGTKTAWSVCTAGYRYHVKARLLIELRSSR